MSCLVRSGSLRDYYCERLWMGTVVRIDSRYNLTHAQSIYCIPRTAPVGVSRSFNAYIPCIHTAVLLSSLLLHGALCPTAATHRSSCFLSFSTAHLIVQAPVA